MPRQVIFHPRYPRKNKNSMDYEKLRVGILTDLCKLKFHSLPTKHHPNAPCSLVILLYLKQRIMLTKSNSNSFVGVVVSSSSRYR